MDAADILRKLLVDRDMTQQGLADVLNVSQSTVGGWLIRRRPVPPKHALRLEKLYGVDACLLSPTLRELRNIEQGAPNPDTPT